MLKLHPLDRSWLPATLPLLSASYGAPVDLGDELDYFDPERALGWFVAVSDQTPRGFVRQFSSGSGHCQLELYVDDGDDRCEVALQLLAAFDASLAQEQVLATWRLPSSSDLLDLARQALPGDERVFRTYEADLQPPLPFDAAVRALEVREAARAQAVLSSLVVRDLQRLERSLEAGLVWGLEVDQELIACAEVNRHPLHLELATLVVSPERRRRGYGRRLLRGVRTGFSESDLPWRAQIKESNLASLRLFESLGFQELTELRQVWSLTRYPKASALETSG
jgi:ribosomal protein S18 acetylase RimI-like enzyme